MSIGKLELVPNALLVLCLLGLISATGCKPPGPMITARGTVTAGKNPLSDGLITFVPDRGTHGQKISVEITQGAYQISGDKGLQQGKYTVEIYGMSPGMRAMINGQPPSHEKSDYREIAPMYNSQSVLSAVLKEGDNENNFTVEHL